MSKFWEIEEGRKTQYLTPDEKICEKHFERNVTRNSEGRYSVALPFNSKKSQLGHSKTMALNRFQTLERRFARDSQFKREYSKIIQEYLDLGHLTKVTHDEEDEIGFYLPHHDVFKKGSLTTAVRVVFDASAKSSTGVSLNDILYIGPTIQAELFSLMVRFRSYPVVLTGDIEKMYRQFLIRKEDRKYQRILWRDSTGQVAAYELNTVTFGVAPAPYLAIRCLHQLAEDENKKFPLASEVIKNDFYVDDALTGAQTIDEAIAIRNQLINLLQRGGLTIRQWASNRNEVLQDLPAESINKHLLLGDFTLKTLGVRWDSVKDVISYVVHPLAISVISKRTVLSEIARIFDPLGLLAPIITTAKILMQKIWTSKLDWDESLPASLHTEWMNYHQELQSLNEISFDRYALLKNTTKIELHGFCDASENAYGACIYIRSTNSDGTCQSILLCAKSRVAPIKVISIPRLELCGALLLAHLMENIKEALKLDIFRTRYWTDSTIVLHWLKTSSKTLKTFVANRVSEIQSKTDINDWLHVRTHDNPADLISRGQKPTEFMKSSLWRFGPLWLQENETEWPQQISFAPPIDELLEKRQIQCFNLKTIQMNLLEKYSTLSKLKRVVAYCLRFKSNNKNKGPLTAEELMKAMQCIIKMLQKSSFSEEIQRLASTNGTLNSNSRLLPLNPFIDHHGILRVGGRLQQAKIPFDEKHPILIPKAHHVTNLLIIWEHRRHLHAGVQATLYALRKTYWICDGRSQVRKVIRSCITCAKLQPLSTSYIMGQLPFPRVNQSRPFSRVGIDYCGPFLIKEKKHRNRNKLKIFVAVFVCFATKAVHLELVTDLSTDAFLAAFRRFISRRGLCNEMYSDNGTNFVGANNEIKAINSFLRTEKTQQEITNFASNQGITWHFIPARAPHFGGLWEAAVKSFKHHLRRVVGIQLFTYEEFNTFVIEIEAILNSRPLIPISSDPNDYSALTPGHFIIGDSLTGLPERDFRTDAVNQLSRWKHILQLKQHFWSRWSKEYINELTIRHKWTKGKPCPTVGSIVVLKEDNLPPLQWAIGRILKIHPGPDGIVRVVTVKTSRGVYDRSVHKIGLLPVQPIEQSSKRN